MTLQRTFCLTLGVLLLANIPLSAQDWATIQGQVILKKGQAIPKPRKIQGVPAACLVKGPLFTQDWIVNAKNRGVKNVFVWLEPAFPGTPMKIHPDLQNPKPRKLVLDQPCCMFAPGCTVLREGDMLVVKNPAPIVHNFRWVGIKNNGNINMPPKSQFVIKNLLADRIPNQLKCDIHPWMVGWIRVFDHPYYALTDENGRFKMASAPAGKYRLKIWHPASGWLGGAEGVRGIPLQIPEKGVLKVNMGEPLELEKR